MEELIKAGKIFIYPTDTIYGIGCDATNKVAVQKIRTIKQRTENSFSIIPPSQEWIEKNTDCKEGLAAGPFTYIAKLTGAESLAANVHPAQDGEIGLRIPKHWFAATIAHAGVPFVSTSVNLQGKPNMTSLEDLDPVIRDQVDIIIYEGPLRGSSSAKIDLSKEK